MGWQDLVVFVIVGAALAFLVNRLVGNRRRRTRPAETFIPLAKVGGRKSHCDP
jgi:hypothetical protein